MSMNADGLKTVREIENTWIPLGDGCRLAARIWMPENAEKTPVPAILEYLPYRKRDGTADRDATTHPYMAAHGYACIRVDMRGNGDSDGLMEDEYLVQEQDDALEVIQWLTQQTWCSGSVGMIGISWGGFNGLQVAARQPDALKAVISICSTDDRYADDIHYMGGCLLNDNLGWASTMLAYSTRPPDPLVVGDNWRETWMNRLENLPFLAAPWLSHQHRDAYWQHGSICEDYEAIKTPVFLVGGWADGYTNTIFRMLKQFNCPVKALVGPWAHKYPHFAKPGPAVGFLQECIKFWDHWLKGKKTDTMDTPIQLYVQDSHPPLAMKDKISGNWIGQESWPSSDTRTQFLYPSGNRLENIPGSGLCEIHTPQTLGSRGGRWFPMGTGPDLPVDQQTDDQEARVFESLPLESDLTICGAPVLKISLASDQPFGLIAVRLNDVRPDNSIARMSYGVLNLTHYQSHEHPEPLVPGQSYSVTIQMNEIGWTLKPGHRIRLSLSNTYWPLIWPSPGFVTLTMDLSGTCLELPVLAAKKISPPMLPPESGAPLEQTVIRPSKLDWTVEEDIKTHALTTRNLEDYGERIISSHGLRTSLTGTETWSAGREDPFSPRGNIEIETLTARGEWQINTRVNTRMRADENNFYVSAEVTALEGEEQVFHKCWDYTIKRNLV